MRFQDDLSASRVELSDGRVLTKCDQCRQMYSERTPPGVPPCKSCRVELVEDNEDAAKVYLMVRNQTVQTPTDKGVIIDLSIPAVKIAMDLHGVKQGDQLGCLERVRRTFYAMRKGDEG